MVYTHPGKYIVAAGLMLRRKATWLQNATKGHTNSPNPRPIKGEIMDIRTANPPPNMMKGCKGPTRTFAAKLTMDRVPVILNKIGKTTKEAQRVGVIVSSKGVRFSDLLSLNFIHWLIGSTITCRASVARKDN